MERDRCVNRSSCVSFAGALQPTVTAVGARQSSLNLVTCEFVDWAGCQRAVAAASAGQQFRLCFGCRNKSVAAKVTKRVTNEDIECWCWLFLSFKTFDLQHYSGRCHLETSAMPCMALQLQAGLTATTNLAVFSSVSQQRPCVLRHRQNIRCQAANTSILSRTQQSAGTAGRAA